MMFRCTQPQASAALAFCLFFAPLVQGAPPVSPEVESALKSLKGASAETRHKAYDLIADKGDSQVISALKAYRDGSLQLVNGRLALYGARITLTDKGSVLPLQDALTGEPIKGDDGQPIFHVKPDLSNALRAPPRSERETINGVISGLALLDPDPIVRVESIRDVGEWAAQVFVDQGTQKRLALDCTSGATAIRDGAPPTVSAQAADAAAALQSAAADKPANLVAAAPGAAVTLKAKAALVKLQSALKAADRSASTIPPQGFAKTVADMLVAVGRYQDSLDAQQKLLDDLPRYSAALKRQLAKDPNSRFAPVLKESIAECELIFGDEPTRIDAARLLGRIGTARAANILDKVVDAATRIGNQPLLDAARKSLNAARSYQTRIHIIQNTFAGLSLGSILVLMALGLSIIFGLMGVINMAHGEFMMVGAFTTYVVSSAFKHLPPGAYDYYLIAAVPAAFLVSGAVGFICEMGVIRFLYGRPLDSLLATWGIGLILIATARYEFGDTLTFAPPGWMKGGVEIAADLTFPLNRVYIILFCVICIALVYFLVNKTKLGLLLRATTQNREMAAALGVATRRVDGLTFALGAGLAGLAGVVVPFYNKINPNIGQEYIVDSFMVVVTGGVGKLAGVIWSGLGLGFFNKYLEALLEEIPSLASGASVIAKVIVLASIVIFLQWRPSGLFPPKGRMADA